MDVKRFGARAQLEEGALQSALAGEGYLVFDGAMGTMLQREGLAAGDLPELLCLTEPDRITGIHRAYVEAGSQVVTTNTFGANKLKLAGAAAVDEVFARAVECARASGADYVAADVGPLGELLAPMGDLSFSEAFDLFAEQGEAIAKTAADLVIIETMADVLEAVAAVMGIRATCDLPVIATMTFTAQGRTFMGSAPREAAIALGALGVDALGVNCSAGPRDLQPVVAEMLQAAPCPVIVQANAGLPEVVDGVTSYTLAPGDYASDVLPMVQAGATIVGGCCGTDSAYISAVRALVDGRAPSRTFPDAAAFDQMAEDAADGAGRDAEVLEFILDAGSAAELKDALAEEYDEG